MKSLEEKMDVLLSNNGPLNIYVCDNNFSTVKAITIKAIIQAMMDELMWQPSYQYPTPEKVTIRKLTDAKKPDA